MTIFLRELKANRKALIIWCSCMFLLVVSGMSKFTAYSSTGASSEVIKNIPASLKAVLGFGSFDVTKMSGFFAFLFLYIEVAVAIHAALLGAGIIAKEERDKTTEFLMIKPVSRTTVITSKLLAALMNVVILNIVTLITSIVMVPVFNKGKDISGEIVLFFISMFLVQMIFLTLGAVMAAFMHNSKGSGSLAAGLVLIAYFVSIITNLSASLKFLNILSPFKYFSYSRIVDGNGLSFVIILISILLIAAFSYSTYYFYQKRDLKV